MENDFFFFLFVHHKSFTLQINSTQWTENEYATKALHIYFQNHLAGECATNNTCIGKYRVIISVLILTAKQRADGVSFVLRAWWERRSSECKKNPSDKPSLFFLNNKVYS